MKQVLRFLALAALICVPWVTQAQSVTIGSGTATSTYLPGYNYYKYAISQQIYTAEEINASGTITSISFYKDGTQNSNGSRMFDIYMAHTTKSSFNSSSDWIALTDADIVFHGTTSYSFTNDAWNTFTLENPFNYNGTDNLVICVIDRTNAYASSSSDANKYRVFSTGSDYQAIYKYSDSYSSLTPDGHNGTTAITYDRSQSKNQIVLGGIQQTCAKPTNLAASLDATDHTIATLNWTENGEATSWVLQVATNNTFTEGLNSYNVSDTPSKDLTGLTPETKYYARVRPSCSETLWSDVCEFKPSAAVCDVIGTGTSSAKLIVTSYGCTYSQHIYTASELTAMGFTAGDIVSVSFYYSGASSSYDKTQSIYMGTTTKSSYSSDAASEFESDVTLVYGPQLLSYVAGWREYELTTPFEWDGESNIVVGMLTNANNGTSSGWDAAGTSTSPDNKTIYRYRDNTPIDITNLASVSYGSYATTRPNINLCILVSPTPKPKNLHLVDNSLSSTGATLAWIAPTTATPTGYEYQYKSGSEWPTDWTDNDNNLSVTLNTLTASTTYSFRVRAIYDGVGESDPVETSFTTLDNCAFPTNLTATTTPGQGTKATFTWVKGYDETQWVLQYGTDENFGAGTYSEKTTGFTVEGNNVTANLTGLTAETKYYARVKANCDGPTSEWSNVADFTPTNYVDFTYNETASSTNSYMPFYYYTTYATNQSQFIIPATALGDIAGGQIRSITYYTSSTATLDFDGAEFDVYMAEVEQASFSSATFVDWTTLGTPVYSGTVSLANSKMTITFDDNFSYSGGNLLIGFKNTRTGSNSTSFNWTVVYNSSSYTQVYQYGSNSASRSYYQPKVTFNYQPTPYVKIAAINEGTITTTSAQLTWAAPETSATITGYAYQYKLSSAAEWPTTWSNLAANATSVTLQSLTAGSSYDFRIKVLYGEHESAITSTSFYTECDAVTAFPWTEDFEAYAAGNFNHPCWVNAHISGEGENIFKVYTSTNGTNNTHQLQLPDQTSGTMTMLVLPGMTLPNSNYQFVIDVFRTNSTYSPSDNPYEGIRIYASTNGEIEGATELAFIPRQYDETNGAIPAEAAEGWYTYEIPLGISGTCYIILRGENRYCSSTYMDNFVVNEMPSCLKPTLVTCTATTTTSATLSWTAGDPGDDAWQISYKTGTDEWSTPADITTNPYTLTGLTENTTYDVRVRTNCGDGEENKSEWTATVTFTTPCEAITVDGDHPYVVDMMSDDIADCWTESDGAYHWDFSNYYGATFTSSSYSLQTSNKLVSPVFDFGAGDNWLSFTGYLEGYEGYYDDYTASLKVYYRTSPSGAWQELTGQSYSATGDNDLDLDVAEVLLPANTCQLAFEATSDYSYAYAYLYGVTVEKVPTCRKPKTPTCNSKTAHTATLSWTNGEAGQTAWQIAYSTEANFDPNSVTPVDVTTNPATIDGLEATTTYYAYVRANCGNGDYSAWSVAKATFTTITGKAAPTGLAVDNSTITSSAATVNWTGVATNDYHQSFDIYYSGFSTRPEPLDADSLIEGLTDASYAFTHLEAEKKYYVWVRDNCGTDGLSNWSSSINFTTASDCQTPDGLAATNVEAHSATITWNTYGQSEFNLRYSDDNGVNWHTVLNATTPYILTVTSNTDYQVQVQAACNTEVWSTVLNFSTPCEAIDITAATPYIEDFEAPVTTAGYNTSNAADLVVPDCWDNYTSNISYNYAIPHIIKSDAGSSGYNYSSPASQVLYFYGSGNGYAALPMFSNDWSELQISFKWATESNSYGTLTLGYITDEDVNYNTFTEIKSYPASSASNHTLVQAEPVYLGGLPANATRLVFRWYYSSWYGANVDDVKVSLLTKDIAANQWYAIASPTHNSGDDMTVAGVDNLTDGTYDLLGYNETNATWESQKTHNDFIFERGKGYIYRNAADKTLTFNGTANSGNIDVTLTATDAAGTMKGWNLLGNPYAHTYALTRDCYSLSTNGTWTVHAGSYTMAVAEAVLVKSNGETFHFTETPATKSAPASTIAFTVSNDEFTDIAYARFSSEEGLPKISHLNPEAPMLSIDGYAIANLNEGTESFPMSFSGQGSYTLTVSGNTDVTGYLHLVDRLTGRDIDLLSTPSYSFTGSPVSDRFTVKLTPDANEGNSTSRFAIFDGNSLIVNGEGTLEVYDVMGRRLMSAEVTGSEYRIPGSDLHTGVYVLRMNGNSQKIVIK